MRLLIILFLSVLELSAQAYIIPDLERDDFKNFKSWWTLNTWGTNHTGGVSNGYFTANLNSPLNGAQGGPLLSDSEGMENIGFSTAYSMMIYNNYDVIDARIRVKFINPMLPGSRGAGLWRSESLPITINQETWYMEQAADEALYSWAPEENWWLGRVTRGVSTEISATPPVSSQDWHYYRILRHAHDYYELYVDDDPTPLVHAEPAELGGLLTEDYGFNCWTDNLTYHKTQNAISGNDTIEVYYNGWQGTLSFVVDFVEIRYNNYQLSHMVSPDNVVRLRDVVNEIDNGVSDGLWKGPYNFNVTSGPCVILATGKAEKMDNFDTDDDLKMILDSKDFGWNSARSWNGDVDQGQPKTIMIDTVLAPGTHTLAFHSEVTPILYDATVLNSANGAVALNLDLNETAPNEENGYLWKTYQFSCDSGMAAIYISGSADEEPGWNHRNYYDGVFADIDSTDDDELRIELDDINYQWESDSSFLGNRLFGDSKTILITQPVGSGSHTLKLYANYTPTIYKLLVYVENKESGSAIENQIIPAAFSLEQNYPNPFNPATAISFNLNKRSHVTLTIYDINGRVVRHLMEGDYSVGTHKEIWNGVDDKGEIAASGIYIYQLKSEGQTRTKKMTLLR